MDTNKRTNRRSSDQNRFDAPKTVLPLTIKETLLDLTETVIGTTQGKLLAILEDNYRPHRRWEIALSNFGSLLTLLLTLATANFHDALGLHKNVWTVLFILLIGPSACWLGHSVWVASIRKHNSPTDILRQIKKRAVRVKDTHTKLPRKPAKRSRKRPNTILREASRAPSARKSSSKRSTHL